MTSHPDRRAERMHRSSSMRLGTLLIAGALCLMPVLSAAEDAAKVPAKGSTENAKSTDKVSTAAKKDAPAATATAQKATKTAAETAAEAAAKTATKTETAAGTATKTAAGTATKTATQTVTKAKDSTPVVSASAQSKTAADPKGTVDKPAASPQAQAAPPVAKSASATQKTARKAKPAQTKAASARGQAKTTTVVPQDERVTYQYNALGRRDPFQPLIGGGFIGRDIVDVDVPPDVGGITVVGIVWGARDKFALAEDPSGKSLVLRRGDKVMNGFVERLKRDAIIVRLINDGQSQSVTIPLTRKGENHGGN